MIVLHTTDVLKFVENYLAYEIKIKFDDLKVDIDFKNMNYDRVNERHYVDGFRNIFLLSYRNHNGVKIYINTFSVREYLKKAYPHCKNVELRIYADDELMLENSVSNDEAMDYVKIEAYITNDHEVEVTKDMAYESINIALSLKNEAMFKQLVTDYAHLL